MMNQKPEDVNQSPRSRTLDYSLELQYQDFSLIATLLMYVYNDDTYIPQHYDVVQAFQWLWRSNATFAYFTKMPSHFNGYGVPKDATFACFTKMPYLLDTSNIKIIPR